MTDQPIIQPDSAKIKPVHITCPNCKTAVFNGITKCPKCGTVIDWPEVEKPKVEKKK